jgi:hypothetical protein
MPRALRTLNANPFRTVLSIDPLQLSNRDRVLDLSPPNHSFKIDTDMPLPLEAEAAEIRRRRRTVRVTLREVRRPKTAGLGAVAYGWRSAEHTHGLEYRATRGLATEASMRFKSRLRPQSTTESSPHASRSWFCHLQARFGRPGYPAFDRAEPQQASAQDVCARCLRRRRERPPIPAMSGLGRKRIRVQSEARRARRCARGDVLLCQERGSHTSGVASRQCMQSMRRSITAML